MDFLTRVNEQNIFKIGKFGSLFRHFNKFRHDSEHWLHLFNQGN